MTYERLLKERIIEACEVSDEEVAGKLRSARHDIEVAQNMSSLDLDWAFTIAYNGILQTALAYMNYLGYRPRGEGKHLNTFKFLSAALPKEFQSEISRLQKLRKKRNQAVYYSRGIVSLSEAEDIIAFSQRFQEEIGKLLPPSIVRMSKEP